jgi:hypothetical protein
MNKVYGWKSRKKGDSSDLPTFLERNTIYYANSGPGSLFRLL